MCLPWSKCIIYNVCCVLIQRKQLWACCCTFACCNFFFFCYIYSLFFFLSWDLLWKWGMLNNRLTFSFYVLNLNALNVVVTSGMRGEKRYQVLLFRLNCVIADWYFSMYFHDSFCHGGSVRAFRKMEWCNYQVHTFINPCWLKKASSSSPVAHS